MRPGQARFALITSRRAPRADLIRLPDSPSRLRRAPLLELGVPDDSVPPRAALDKLFKDRQVQIEPGLVDYLALRLERSLGAARTFVDRLDREALSRGRRLTRALAAELLERETRFDV